MSQLEELLQTLSPDGVEYKPLGSVVKILTAPQKLNRSQYRDSGQYAIVDQGQTLVIGFTDYAKATLPKNKYVVFGDHTRIVKYIDFPFAQGADGLKILLPKDNLIESKYLFYAFTNLQVPSRGYNRHWSVAQELLIPVPPLPVQEEIVRILDTFSGVVTELEAEQAARVRQYEHYRESLFLFTRENTSQILIRHDLSHIPSFGIEEAEVCSLSEVCTISNGRDHKPLNDGNIPVYGSGGIMRYVDQPIYSDESVLIPRKGSIGNIYYVNEPFWVVDTIFYTKIDKERINPKFLYHFLVTQHLEDLNMAGGVPSLTKSMLDKVMIPIPPMSDQNAIVSILDRFDTLVNDLKSGLPAEIALRRKQYEYYRDKLLTFPAKQPPL